MGILLQWFWSSVTLTGNETPHAEADVPRWFWGSVALTGNETIMAAERYGGQLLDRRFTRPGGHDGQHVPLPMMALMAPSCSGRNPSCPKQRFNTSSACSNDAMRWSLRRRRLGDCLACRYGDASPQIKTSTKLHREGVGGSSNKPPGSVI